MQMVEILNDPCRMAAGMGFVQSGHNHSCFRWKISLIEDGSVVTQDGEYLGTWQSDENDHPSFTPDGASEALLFSVFVWSLCDKIEKWRQSSSRVSDPPIS